MESTKVIYWRINAVTSSSTRAPFGRRDTSTALRAGKGAWAANSVDEEEEEEEEGEGRGELGRLQKNEKRREGGGRK